MAAALDACEKDLQILLVKIDNVKSFLLDAVNAVKKAKSSINELPPAVIQNEDVNKVFAAITEQMQFLMTVQAPTEETLIEEKTVHAAEEVRQNEETVEEVRQKEETVEENRQEETEETRQKEGIEKECIQKEGTVEEIRQEETEETRQKEETVEEVRQEETEETRQKEEAEESKENEAAPLTDDSNAPIAEGSIEESQTDSQETEMKGVKQTSEEADLKQQSEESLETLKPWTERGELYMRVTSPLLKDGTFWCVQEYGVNVELLNTISQKLRMETMHNRDLWKCDVRNKDQVFCVLSKVHNMWLRAIIEKELSESDVVLRYIDTGKTEKVQKSRLNRLPDNLKDIQPLTLRCCFTRDPIKVPYEVKWTFKDITDKHTLALNVEDEVRGSCLPRYIVSLKRNEENAEDIKDIICKELKESGRQKVSTLLSQDVRLYGENSNQKDKIAVIRDVHRSDNKNEEKKQDSDTEKEMLDKVEGETESREEVENGQSEATQKLGGEKKGEPEIIVGMENTEKGDLKTAEKKEGTEKKKLKEVDKIDVNVSGSLEGLSWGDLCKTPDANNQEEKTFLPVDDFESISDGERKSPIGGEKLAVSGSKPGIDEAKPDSSAGLNETRHHVESTGVLKEEEKLQNEDKLVVSMQSADVGNEKIEESYESGGIGSAVDGSLKGREEEHEIPKADSTEIDMVRRSEEVIKERLRAVCQKSSSTTTEVAEEKNLSGINETEIYQKNVSKQTGDSRKVSDSAKSDGGVGYTLIRGEDVPKKREAKSESDSYTNQGGRDVDNVKNPTNRTVSNKGFDKRTDHGFGNKIDRRRRTREIVEKEDLFTQSESDRNNWLKNLDRGLRHAVFDSHNTRYFVKLYDSRFIEDAYRTSRFQNFIFTDFNNALENIRKKPVVLFILRRAADDTKRLCAVALVTSCAYRFPVPGKGGSRKEMELFDVDFLCKAAMRTKWLHSQRGVEEIEREKAVKIVEQYRAAIQQGNVEKLLDEWHTKREQTAPRFAGQASHARLWKPHQEKEHESKRMPERDAMKTGRSLNGHAHKEHVDQNERDVPLSLKAGGEQSRDEQEASSNFLTEPTELWSPTPLTEKQLWTLDGPVEKKNPGGKDDAQNDGDGRDAPAANQQLSHQLPGTFHGQQQPFTQQQQLQYVYQLQQQELLHQQHLQQQQQQQQQQPFPQQQQTQSQPQEQNMQQQQHQHQPPSVNFNRQYSEEEKLYMYQQQRMLQFMLFQQQQQQQLQQQEQQLYQQDPNGPGFNSFGHPTPFIHQSENWDLEIHGETGSGMQNHTTVQSANASSFTGSVNDLGSDDEAERDLRRERDVFDLVD
ncbi:trichohyalin-like isoform X2 [Rhopilema esculentum]|uniref:trichohyalin-like isoform X2 n=1 Tax=Rhopilema esculentum TaxID=499914 RepID=UPI0031DF3303